MFDSSVHEDTPLLSRKFITVTHRDRPPFCTPKVFFKTLRGCFAEFFAMIILMFVSAMTMRNVGEDSGGSVLLVAIGNGFSYGVLVSTTMHISSGFLNPAATVGVVVAGIVNPITGACYLLVQILGAATGAALVSLYSESAINAAVHHLRHLPGKDDIDTSTILLAILYEVLTTSLLVMVVLNSAIDKASKSRNVAPIVLGFSVTVGILATFEFTGGSLNPARSLGPAIVGTSDSRWDYHYIYWIGPVIGAVLTAAIYRLMFASKPWIPIFKQLVVEDNDSDRQTAIN